MRLALFLILSSLIHLLFFPLLSFNLEPSPIVIIEADLIGSEAVKPSSSSLPKIKQVALPTTKPRESSKDSQSESPAISSNETMNEGLGRGSDGTQPPQVLKEFLVPYPNEAKRSRIEGDVVLQIIINELGKVENPQVLQSLGYGLDEAALYAIQQFDFIPGFKEGKVVKTQIKYRYKFRLD